jgi:hypothetical protein
VAFLVLSGSVAQGAAVIDFEDWAGVEGHQFGTLWGGCEFAGGFSVSLGIGTNNPSNVLHGHSSNVKFVEATNTPFTIFSLDLQEGVLGSDTVSITLVGSRSSLPNIAQTFALDGLSSTFQTFYPTGFIDVNEVFFYPYNAQGQISTAGFSVDNIVLPEPTMLCLLLLGAVMVRRWSLSTDKRGCTDKRG